MNYFPKLSQREGTVELPDGRALVVKLLPVRFLDAYFDVLEECGDGAEAQATGLPGLRPGGHPGRHRHPHRRR